MDADKRRWVLVMVVAALFLSVYGQCCSKAYAFVDRQWVAAQETKKLQAKYERIICWGFAYSEQHVGYGFPRVNAEDLEINGIGYAR